MDYKKNDILVIDITDIGTDGEGIGKMDGYTLFVKDALPGDKAKVKIMKAKKNYAYAHLEQIVEPSKDVDCMSDENFAHVFAQDSKGYPPCTPEAVIEILKHYNIPMAGKKVVVVGRSMVVGKPLAMLLLKENATVTICHTKTANLEEECKKADIICAAAGAARMIKSSFVRPGQVVVDVGINMVDGQMCGDVDYDGVSPIVEAVTPVPGGVGTVTTTMLLKHVIKSAGAVVD